MQEDIAWKRKTYNTRKGLQPQVSLFTWKPTTPPLLLRQSKQVTIQVTENHHRAADLTECYRTTCSPCSLSCTLACWSRSRYLFSPQCLLASSAQLTSQTKPPASFITNSHWLHLPGILFPSFTITWLWLLLPSFLHRTALLPGLSSPSTAAAGSSVLPSFKLASGLLSAAPVFLGSLNPLLCRPGSAANASR